MDRCLRRGEDYYWCNKVNDYNEYHIHSLSCMVHSLQHLFYIIYYGNIDSILVQPGKWKLGLLLTEVEISMDTNILSIGCQLNILGGGQIFGELT